jgi:hypothetical protein
MITTNCYQFVTVLYFYCYLDGLSYIAPIKAQARNDNSRYSRQPISQSHSEQRQIVEFFALEEIGFADLWLGFHAGKDTEKVGHLIGNDFGILCVGFVFGPGISLAPGAAKLRGYRPVQADR